MEHEDTTGGRSSRRTIIVSFSGIDGAGKSTQIEGLVSRLMLEGMLVRVVRFWDDIARLKTLREASGHRIFKGDKGVGSPERPIKRRDKNVQSRWMTCVRLFLYFVDAISARNAVRKALRSGADIVVFDRYTYDELANLNLRSWIIRLYARFLLKLVPRPDISYLLDADPEKARARKPEYPLEFLRSNRDAYLMLADLADGITVVQPGQVREVAADVLSHASRKVPYLLGGLTHEKWAVERP